MGCFKPVSFSAKECSYHLNVIYIGNPSADISLYSSLSIQSHPNLLEFVCMIEHLPCFCRVVALSKRQWSWQERDVNIIDVFRFLSPSAKRSSFPLYCTSYFGSVFCLEDTLFSVLSNLCHKQILADKQTFFSVLTCLCIFNIHAVCALVLKPPTYYLSLANCVSLVEHL